MNQLGTLRLEKQHGSELLGISFCLCTSQTALLEKPPIQTGTDKKSLLSLAKDQEMGSLFDNKHSLEKHLGGLQAPLTSISKGLTESLDLYPFPKRRGTLPCPHWGGIKEAQRGAWTCTTPPPRERAVPLPLSIESGEAR